MSTVTTHVLDTTLGQPASGVPVRLEHAFDGTLADGQTDAEGRCALGPNLLPAGTYRLVFDTGGYFATTSQPLFYPEVVVTFLLDTEGQHWHLPLLLSSYGYTTYRGS